MAFQQMESIGNFLEGCSIAMENCFKPLIYLKFRISLWLATISIMQQLLLMVILTIHAQASVCVYLCVCVCSAV